jgi:4'-phosphopantetheinyl transferase
MTVKTLIDPVAGALGEDEVHVWRIALDCGGGDSLRSRLSSDELARAARFHFERDRTRFSVARAALREILAHYLGTGPAEIAFVYGDHGKPALAPYGDLHFNLSHSHDLALCAVTRGREVGVDVERIRELDDLEGIATATFSQRERETLAQLAGPERLAGFFNAWTRKEAFVKALGEGLSHPLDRFDVSLAPTARPRLERIDGDSTRAARWSLAAVVIDAAHAAAVVVEGRGLTLVARRWPEDLVPATTS